MSQDVGCMHPDLATYSDQKILPLTRFVVGTQTFGGDNMLYL